MFNEITPLTPTGQAEATPAALGLLPDPLSTRVPVPVPVPDGVARVAAELARLGHPQPPVMLSDAARTAQQAADALGVALGQIAKSIIFRRKPDGVAVLVIASGDRRVDEAKVQALVCSAEQQLGRANADFVKQATGFSIGGVSPLAHATPPVTLIDEALFRFGDIWAAAGHPHAVFRLTPAHLSEWTGAPVANVTLAPTPVPTQPAPPCVAPGTTPAMPSAAVVQPGEQAEPSKPVWPAMSLQATRLKAALRHREGSGICPPAVPSPCTGVCRMDSALGWCQGCYRTVDELAHWSRASDSAKLATWAQLEQRQHTVPR